MNILKLDNKKLSTNYKFLSQNKLFQLNIGFGTVWMGNLISIIAIITKKTSHFYLFSSHKIKFNTELSNTWIRYP